MGYVVGAVVFFLAILVIYVDIRARKDARRSVIGRLAEDNRSHEDSAERELVKPPTGDYKRLLDRWKRRIRRL